MSPYAINRFHGLGSYRTEVKRESGRTSRDTTGSLNGKAQAPWRVIAAVTLASLLAGALAVPATAQAPASAVDVPIATNPDATRLARQLAEYRAQVPKTIIELQPFRQTTSASIQDAAGERGGAAARRSST